MQIFRPFLRNKILSRGRLQILPQRNNASLDTDDYHIKYPAATMVGLGCLCIAYLIYDTNRTIRRIEEDEINRTPLSERERDPDVGALLFDWKTFRP